MFKTTVISLANRRAGGYTGYTKLERGFFIHVHQRLTKIVCATVGLFNQKGRGES